MSVTSATKQKLDGLLNEFSEFENIMKEGTRQRREQDEQKLLALKVEMGQIEKTLNSEVKRRVEMNKSLQNVGKNEFGEDMEIVPRFYGRLDVICCCC